MISLTIHDLVAHAGSLNPLWLKAAFLLFLVGYGTKMGLAPLHTWLPDAHSEAPSVVSALLSGGAAELRFFDDPPRALACCPRPPWAASAPISWCSSA